MFESSVSAGRIQAPWRSGAAAAGCAGSPAPRPVSSVRLMTPVRRAVEDVIKYRDIVGMDRIVISSSSISFWLGRSCNAIAVRRIEHCQAKQIQVRVKKIRKAIQENPLRTPPDNLVLAIARRAQAVPRLKHGAHVRGESDYRRVRFVRLPRGSPSSELSFIAHRGPSL